MSATIFAGNFVKTLKAGLNLFNNATIWSGNIDPSSGGGFAANFGDAFLSTLTGDIYLKQGPGNTAWAPVSTVGGSWKTPVTNSASLPVSGNTSGDARVTLDTGYIWEWTGSAWQLLGTVTNTSVVSANGFAGTVATSNTTPAITIETTVNSPVLAGNGTAISAATTTGTGSTVVLSAFPTLTGTVSAAAVTLSSTLTLSSLGAGVARTSSGGVVSSSELSGDVTTSGSNATTAAATQNNITSIPNLATVGIIGTGTWQGTAIGTQYGGTGQNFSASTGAISVAAGTMSAGTLSIANGGTGAISTTQFGVVYGASTTAYATTAAGTANFPLVANSSAAPTFQQLSLTAGVTGVLPIANGGTNSSTALTNGQIIWSSGGKIVEAGALTNGQLFIGSTSNPPVASTITAGTGISIANGAGSITVTNTNSSSTDIPVTSFSAANNQSSAANVTGLAFANANVRSFKAEVSVTVIATSNLYETFTLQGIQRGADWQMGMTSVGDSSGFIFSITTAGQVQYTSTNNAGFASATLKFYAKTLPT